MNFIVVGRNKSNAIKISIDSLELFKIPIHWLDEFYFETNKIKSNKFNMSNKRPKNYNNLKITRI